MEELMKAPASESCRLIGFDQAEVITGIVPGQYILVVSGEKPYLNMEVRLVPRIYVQRPDYWEIEVVGCLAGIGLPATAPYHVWLPLDGILGTQGVEVVGASRSERFDVPPESPYVESQVHEADDVPPEERTPNSGDDAGAEPDAERAAADLEGIDFEGIGPEAAVAAAAAQWRVAKSLLALRDQVNRKAPRRSKASDGTIGDLSHMSRDSDHNAWVKDGAVGVVTALDITNDPARGCDAGAIVEAIRVSRDARIKYLIWNRRIASSSSIDGQLPWTWRTYTGTNPHDKHCHISVKPEKPLYDSVTSWRI
jgi:hypothetical protein